MCSVVSGNFWHGELIGQLMRSEPRAGSRRMSRCVEDGIPRDPDATDGHMTAVHYLEPPLRFSRNLAVTVGAGER